MTKWIVFAVYWLSLVLSMRQGALWMWLILLPTFLLLWTWAEEQDEYTGPAADSRNIDQ
jgi:hypothetical protein